MAEKKLPNRAPHCIFFRQTMGLYQSRQQHLSITPISSGCAVVQISIPVDYFIHILMNSSVYIDAIQWVTSTSDVETCKKQKKKEKKAPFSVFIMPLTELSKMKLHHLYSRCHFIHV
ncbi:hypothetical protein CHARACLAT_010885 [Characodon lateralis]|uniref:Uncharacterized protein n=1 Tax=Characodon lateralis TaxID=208331 RepID=A0ABU7CM84_9TELE|nr:hypothetical protein [Characodon lateralis]